MKVAINITLCTICCLLFAGGSYAENAYAKKSTVDQLVKEDNLTNSQSAAIETVVVYAQKRPQDNKDISVTVNTLNEDLLHLLDLKDTTQLSGMIPNAKITANTGEGAPPAISIRGVASLDYNNTTTAPIAVYVDDVVGGALSNSSVSLVDVEQVEVLKGPQGTLFGRNTNGGAILIRSKRPEDELSGFGRMGIGNQSLKRWEGVLNVPLQETTAIRLVYSRQDYDYSSNNLFPSAPQAGMEQQSYRLSLQHRADDFDAYIKVFGANWDGLVKPPRNKGYFLNGTPSCPESQAGTTACTDAFGFNVGSDAFHDVNTDGNAPHETDKSGASMQLQWRLNENHQLISISGFNQLDRLHTFDCDNSPSNICWGDLGVDNTMFTQELRLHSEWKDTYLLSGVFYINEEISQRNQIDLFRDFRAILPSGPAHFFYDNQVDIRSKAIFSQLDLRLSDSLLLTAGLRYTDEETDYLATSDINLSLFAGDLVGTTVDGWRFSGTQEDSKVSGKLALTQAINENINLFYSINKGFKSGGYNGGLAFTPDEARLAQYGPESLMAYEVGSKMSFEDTLFNITAFFYDYEDQQIFMNQQTNEQLSAPAQVLDNVGESTIYGLEVEAMHHVNQHWFLQIGLGYIPKANLKEYVDARGARITNNRLPFTSTWDLNALVRYNIDLGGHPLALQLDVDYQSEFYFDQYENNYAKQDAFTLWNARAVYTFQDAWEVALWVKNLTNEEHSHIIFNMGDAFGLLQDLKGEARRFGVDLSYRF